MQGEMNMRCNQKHLGTQWPSVAISGHHRHSHLLDPSALRMLALMATVTRLPAATALR